MSKRKFPIQNINKYLLLIHIRIQNSGYNISYDISWIFIIVCLQLPWHFAFSCRLLYISAHVAGAKNPRKLSLFIYKFAWKAQKKCRKCSHEINTSSGLTLNWWWRYAEVKQIGLKENINLIQLVNSGWFLLPLKVGLRVCCVFHRLARSDRSWFFLNPVHFLWHLRWLMKHFCLFCNVITHSKGKKTVFIAHLRSQP